MSNLEEFEDAYEYLADFVGYKCATQITWTLRQLGYKGDELTNRLKEIAKRYAKKEK